MFMILNLWGDIGSGSKTSRLAGFDGSFVPWVGQSVKEDT